MNITELILERVSQNFHIEISELKGKSRRSRVTVPRYFFCMLTRELTGLSYDTIGNYINRDHSTVIYGNRIAREIIETYPSMKIIYKKIKYEITLDYAV